MYFYLYISSAVELFSEQELIDLLTTSRNNNARLGITGMLLYKEDNFMQVLEGRKELIKPLADKIALDPRHHRVSALLEGEQGEPQFSNWSMGFRNLDAPAARKELGYNKFMNSPFTGEEFTKHPSRCQQLLLSFKKYM